MEANTPTPSRTARKLILLRAYSASEGLTPRSPPKTVAERCQAGASLGGEHPNPLAHSAKAHPSQSLLSERRPDTAKPRYREAHQKTERSGVRPERALEANTPTPLAHSAKAHPPQSLLSERKPDTAKPRLFCKSLAFTIIPELTLCAFFPTVVSEHHS